MSTSTTSLARHSAVMASGSFVSRILGVVRQSMIVTIFGTSLAGQAWSVANTLPNTIYLLLAGGVLNAVLVPQITKAFHDHDGGQAFVDRLLTLALLGIGVVTLVCLPAAPLLVRLFSAGNWGHDTFALAVSFAYICLPAIFFYGLFTVLGQVLNAQERFAAFTWAPVLCNVVWIAGLGWFLRQFGRGTRAPGEFTPQMIWLLGGSLTVGVALQALALLIPLYRSGFRYRPRFGFRGVGLGSASRVALWTFAALAVSQVGLIVQSQVLTSTGTETGKLLYDSAFLLFMTPHGLITVSLVTALFTSMSRAAAGKDDDAFRHNVRQGLSLTGIATIPIMMGCLILGTSLAALLFPRNSIETTNSIGHVMAAMMLGLPAFAFYYVAQRAFFAFEDAKTPFYLQIINTGIAAVIAIAAMLLPTAYRAIGVGLGQALSNVVGAAIALIWLSRRVQGLQMRSTIQTLARVTVASLIASVPTYLVFVAAQQLLRGRATAAVALLIGVPLFVVLYVVLTRRMKVRQIDEILNPVLRRLRGGRTRSGGSA
ncbi:MAG: murein biosynthesis integral membrane protein MurJ [Micrococcales bacterium]|nr:murein biosynthesis integral membrane protein MurJ [Micrococcales bacterium]